MIETVEQLKKERPDLVESFENMSKEHLLEQCYEPHQTLNKHYIINVYDKSIVLKRLL